MPTHSSSCCRPGRWWHAGGSCRWQSGWRVCRARLVDLLAGGLESQLASLLLRQAGADGIVRLTQGHLAELLGVPRASVQRVLKSLESSELVALRYRRIELVDLTGLVSLSDDSDD